MHKCLYFIVPNQNSVETPISMKKHKCMDDCDCDSSSSSSSSSGSDHYPYYYLKSNHGSTHGNTLNDNTSGNKLLWPYPYGPWSPWSPWCDGPWCDDLWSYYLSKNTNMSGNMKSKIDWPYEQKSLNISIFYALPADNPNPITPGNVISFPNTSDNNCGNITRSGNSNSLFALPVIGTYEITYQLCTSDTCQLIIMLNNSELPETNFGKNGSGEISGTFIIKTTEIYSVLSLNNPKNANTNVSLVNLNSNTSQIIIKQLFT